jgi:hypothetical protein
MQLVRMRVLTHVRTVVHHLMARALDRQKNGCTSSAYASNRTCACKQAHVGRGFTSVNGRSLSELDRYTAAAAAAAANKAGRSASLARRGSLMSVQVLQVMDDRNWLKSQTLSAYTVWMGNTWHRIQQAGRWRRIGHGLVLQKCRISNACQQPLVGCGP